MMTWWNGSYVDGYGPSKGTRAWSRREDTPSDVLVSELGEQFPSLMLGRVYVDDLPNIGEYATIKWWDGDTRYVVTVGITDVDEKYGTVWAETHWKGWLGDG